MAGWLEKVVHVLAVVPRPAGYSPLGVRNLDPRPYPAPGTERQGLPTTPSSAGTLETVSDERVHEVLGGDPAVYRAEPWP